MLFLLSLSLLCLDKKSSITEMTALWYINTPLWKRAILLRESKCKEIWFILRERRSLKTPERESVRENDTKKRVCFFRSLLSHKRPKISERRAIFFLPHEKRFCSSKFFSQIIYIMYVLHVKQRWVKKKRDDDKHSSSRSAVTALLAVVVVFARTKSEESPLVSVDFEFFFFEKIIIGNDCDGEQQQQQQLVFFIFVFVFSALKKLPNATRIRESDWIRETCTGKRVVVLQVLLGPDRRR